MDNITGENRSGSISTPDDGKIAVEYGRPQGETERNLYPRGQRREAIGKYLDSEIVPLRQQRDGSRSDTPATGKHSTEPGAEDVEHRAFQRDPALAQQTERPSHPELITDETLRQTNQSTGRRSDAGSGMTVSNQPPGASGNPESSSKNRRKTGIPGVLDQFRDEIEAKLYRDLFNEITAPGMLDELKRRHPEAFEGKNRQSLLQSMRRIITAFERKNRRVLPSRWRACERSRAPRKAREGYTGTFRLEHPSGQEVQVDFTDIAELKVRSQGKKTSYKLFVCRLSQSGWAHVEVFKGETVSALMQGLRNAFEELNGVPQVVRSDNKRSSIRDKKPINPYKSFLEHYRAKPAVINYYRPNENGGVEGQNHWIKAFMDQALHFRGSRDFASDEEFAAYVKELIAELNDRDDIQEKLKAERPHLLPLPQTRAPVHIEFSRRVHEPSAIDVSTSKYSVPSRALGQRVNVKLYAEHVDVYDEDGKRLVRWDREHGNNKISIDPGHFFPRLLTKWGHFGMWPSDWKKAMFLTPTFKRAYEKFLEWDPGPDKTNRREADYDYLRILDLALKAGRVQAVEHILQQMLEAGGPFGFKEVKQALDPPGTAGDEGSGDGGDPQSAQGDAAAMVETPTMPNDPQSNDGDIVAQQPNF